MKEDELERKRAQKNRAKKIIRSGASDYYMMRKTMNTYLQKHTHTFLVSFRPRLHEQIKHTLFAQILPQLLHRDREFEQLKEVLFAHVNAALGSHFFLRIMYERQTSDFLPSIPRPFISLHPSSTSIGVILLAL